MKEKKNFKVDFIGVGAAKCGTSWIARCLAEHPQVCFSVPKETFFFNREVIIFRHPNIFTAPNRCYSRYDKEGIAGYKKYFKHCCNNNKQIKGEWCVEYLNDPLVAEKIKKEFPNVKILVCLRNPIDRAYSHFYYFKYIHKFEKPLCTFEKALKDHPTPYVYKSRYDQRLKPYLNLFPKENILILIYEDIKKNPLRFIQSIYKFLGVDDAFVPPSLHKKVNATVQRKHPYLLKFIHLSLQILRKLKAEALASLIKKTKARKIVEIAKSKKIIERPPMKPATRKYLQQIFAEDIKNLEKLIGRDLSFWKIKKG